MTPSIAKRGDNRPALAETVAGLVLVGLAWSVSWHGPEPYRFHTFFPLWLGYILSVDGLLALRSGTSLFRRLGAAAPLAFLLSVPFWWLFELANRRLGNWHYVLPHHYSWLAYHAEASLAFSTVVPAVFVTAELARSVVPGRTEGPVFDPAPAVRTGLAVAGLVLIGLALVWPGLFFPLIWIGFFLAADWLADQLRAPALSSGVRVGDWSTIFILFVSTLWCGFLWEMWNSHALPRWRYELPWAEWGHLFAMPLPGYGGYLPFGLELYALTMLLDRPMGSRLARAVRFDRRGRDA